MPLYEYRAVQGGCETCEVGFEVIQRISDTPLTHCPECNTAVQKCISVVAINVQKSDRQTLSRKNLEKHGFVRYEKSKDGTYVKTAGTSGPETIKKNKSA